MLKKMLASLLAISCLPLIGYNGIFNQKKTSAKAAFYENISNEELDENEYISVSIQFDYPDFVYENDKTGVGVAENQKLLSGKRKASREYHLQSNEKYIQELHLEKLDVKASSYAPFAFKEYFSLDEYINDRKILKEISKSETVVSVTVGEVSKDIIENAATQATGEPTETMTMDDVRAMIGATNVNYTGNGIKVGILDAGYPDDTDNFIDPVTGESDIIASDCYENSEHSTKIMSIIGGSTGLAPNVDFYVREQNPNLHYYFIEGIEWLIDRDVNIINICVGIGEADFLAGGHPGKYDTYVGYLDHLIYTNDLFVCIAAGNNDFEEYQIELPGTSLNAITVGEIDKNKTITYTSSYQMDSSLEHLIAKPTLVAPGANIVIENTPNPDINSEGEVTRAYHGTSFATPVVSGVIALLLERFPAFMGRPEIITSALISGAVPVTGQEDEWDNKAGAGMVHYGNAADILSNSNYTNSGITPLKEEDTLLLQKEVTLPPYDFVRIGLSTFLPSVVENRDDLNFVPGEASAVEKPRTNAYRIEVYSENNVLQETFLTESNVFLGVFGGYSSVTATYTIKVFLNRIALPVGTYVSLSTRVVTHSTHYYIHDYVPYNSTKHKSCCVCGEYILESHVVHSTITPENILNPLAAPPLPGAKTCILCGASVLGSLNIEDGVETMAQITYLTPNGSYQLPNGIIVLNDKDVEAFLNGTLTFGGIL